VIPDIDDVAPALREWFDDRRRDLPWRRDSDPYRVLVSEVMLQQTRVEAVVPYYERWMTRFPTLVALADAGLDDVLGEWEGLGYYSRARNLHATARIVRDSAGGVIPDSVAGLRALPGVGEYTAGAVASIAFGRPEPAVDGNARRVLSRLFDLEAPRAAELRERARTLVPADRPGDFNQALMELGATICRPRAPRCVECPLAAWCLARLRGTVGARPGPASRPPVPFFDLGVAVVVSPQGRALMVRRPEDGMLARLWEFPGRTVAAGEPPASAAARAIATLVPDAEPLRPLTTISHAYSHRRHVYHACLFETPRETRPRPRDLARAGWTAAAWERPDPAGRALPAAQRRIARALASLVPC
jgi:A/G-specific adenine glycosylase